MYTDLAELRMAAVEPKAAIQLRNSGKISDDVLREIEAELDMRAVVLHAADPDYGQ